MKTQCRLRSTIYDRREESDGAKYGRDGGRQGKALGLGPLSPKMGPTDRPTEGTTSVSFQLSPRKKWFEGGKSGGRGRQV